MGELRDIENNAQQRFQRYAQLHMRLTVSPRAEPGQNDTQPRICQIYVGPLHHNGTMWLFNVPLTCTSAIYA